MTVKIHYYSVISVVSVISVLYPDPPITVNYGSGDVIDILMKSFGLLVPEFGFGFHNMQCNVRRNSKLFHFCTQITRLVYV
jgi:hypothetical protein